MADSSIKARLAAARERQSAREQSAQDARDALELEAIELVEKLEKELGAPQGVGFEVLVDRFGVFAVKHVEAAESLYKRFSGIKEPSTEDVEAFIKPCIAYPEEAKFFEITADRPIIKTRLALALATLFGAKEATDRGKF